MLTNNNGYYGNAERMGVPHNYKSVRFERIELKYLISERQYHQILDFIKEYCDEDRYSAVSEQGYVLTSLYLDTRDFDLHRVGRSDSSHRYKIRIRHYDGYDDYLSFEVKEKRGDFITKYRFMSPIESWADAIHNPEILRKDLSTDLERKAHSYFFYRLHTIEACPMILIRYRREAYVSWSDSYARVTFDRGIQWQRTCRWSFGEPYGWSDLHVPDKYEGKSSPIILELKCENHVPMWMLKIVNHFGLNRIGFSKYSNSVDHYQSQMPYNISRVNEVIGGRYRV